MEQFIVSLVNSGEYEHVKIDAESYKTNGEGDLIFFVIEDGREKVVGKFNIWAWVSNAKNAHV